MVPLILDTDFSADVGDLRVLAMACALHKQKAIQLLAVSCCTSADKAPGAISATLKWWGVEAPIGALKTTFDPGIAQNKTWPGHIYDTYDRNGVGLTATVENCVTTMRRALASRPSKDCVILAVGPMKAMAALMNSSADGVSGLTGQQLIAAKCKSLYIMGGQFPSGTEWNAQQAPADIADVATNWPTPIYFNGGEIGGSVYVAGPLASKPSNDLMRTAHENYPGSDLAWDEMALMAAVFGNANYGTVRGTASFNTTTGATTWTNSSSGNHYYLTKSRADRFYQQIVNTLICGDATAATPISSWGARSAIVAAKV